MSEFTDFSKLIHDRYNELSKSELFVVGNDNKVFSEEYLKAFPEGTDPIFKTATEHDCTCCKNFIRNLGNLVTITNGKVQSIWRVTGAKYPYDVVAKHMDEFVLSQPITSVFRSQEAKYGNEQNLQHLPDGNVRKWNHFQGLVKPLHFTKEVGTVVGAFNTGAQVLKRGLDELTKDALDTVLDLINSKALYRGEEHRAAVIGFHAAFTEYHKLTDADKELYIWSNATKPFSRFRNTVIGTLVQDLSEGKDIEYAVKSFETKVAPMNYKRPTALITQGMIKTALATLTELGLESALERRFAKISDVSVNNVLWVNNTAKKQMKGGIEGLLLESLAKPAIKEVKAEDIGIDDFLSKILPEATSLEMIARNSQMSNFMSLTAPVHEDSGKLFKWDNDFAWSYSGNVADSIKDRVKQAGGSVVGDLCCRLAWDYTDDLDFHMEEPGGSHIYYASRRSPNGGNLDVDANGQDGIRENPVENIFYKDKNGMREGVYHLYVNNWNRRSVGVGFEVEIEFAGKTLHMVYDKVVGEDKNVSVAKIMYSKKDGFTIVESLPTSTSSKKVWGVSTETWTPVETVLLSPNYWDENKVGNKHYFFVVKDCVNPEPTRGIYNEFLSSALDPHRKVFELIGARTKCIESDEQLSGLGFSSTRSDNVTVKVTGTKLNKIFNVNF